MRLIVRGKEMQEESCGKKGTKSIIVIFRTESCEDDNFQSLLVFCSTIVFDESVQFMRCDCSEESRNPGKRFSVCVCALEILKFPLVERAGSDFNALRCRKREAYGFDIVTPSRLGIVRLCHEQIYI